MKVISILGTRPEFTKFSPVFDAMDGTNENVIIHTGQHYTFEMDRLFFQQLRLPDPKYNLEVGSGTPTHQLSKIINLTGDVLREENPDIVLVLGDTNTTLGGALAAKKLNYKLGHIEAGCRSFNRHMPEEINRVLVDSISDILFAPDTTARTNLLNEGIPAHKISVTGSTSLEAVRRNVRFADEAQMPPQLAYLPEEYVVTTIHRAENTDNQGSLSQIVYALNKIIERIQLIFPIHPRTEKMIRKFDLSINPNIITTEPLGYLQFLRLLSNAKFIISDSGGIQEEAASLNVPCFIPRLETEWNYLIDAKKNFLVGVKADDIILGIFPYLDDPERLASVRRSPIELDYNASAKIIEGINRMI